MLTSRILVVSSISKLKLMKSYLKLIISQQILKELTLLSIEKYFK